MAAREVKVGKVTLIHEGENLIVRKGKTRKVWSYIGAGQRSDQELIAIYKKYLNPRNGR